MYGGNSRTSSYVSGISGSVYYACRTGCASIIINGVNESLYGIGYQSLNYATIRNVKQYVKHLVPNLCASIVIAPTYACLVCNYVFNENIYFIQVYSLYLLGYVLMLFNFSIAIVYGWSEYIKCK